MAWRTCFLLSLLKVSSFAGEQECPEGEGLTETLHLHAYFVSEEEKVSNTSFRALQLLLPAV